MESKPLTFSTREIVKLVKSLGIATGGAASVIFLAYYDIIDAEMRTVIFTAIGTWVFNILRVWVSGSPRETV